MRLEWTHPALSDLIEAQSYIAQESSAAAETIGQRVWDTSQLLSDNPYCGREGHVAETRELVVARTPYIIVYRIIAETVEVLHIHHGRQNWQV